MAELMAVVVVLENAPCVHESDGCEKGEEGTDAGEDRPYAEAWSVWFWVTGWSSGNTFVLKEVLASRLAVQLLASSRRPILLLPYCRLCDGLRRVYHAGQLSI